jgi:predicted transcriptional regulator
VTQKKAAGSKELRVGIGDLREIAAEFEEVWRGAEAGRPIRRPRERLLFSDLPTLLRALTPKRWELLRDLRRSGPSSVRALARRLSREHKSVCADLSALERYGLVSRDAQGRVAVPWSRITAELYLDRAA